MQLKCSIAALGIAGLLVMGGAGMSGMASLPAADDSLFFVGGDPVSRQVQIGDRFYTVTILVTRSIAGAPLDPPQTPNTSVSVQLSVNDGAQLPVDLRVMGVRFEKLRGVNRFFFVPTELQVADPGDFELDQRDYLGDMSDRPNVQRLKATIRLKNGDQVIRMPMGVIEVRTLLLP